MSAPNLTTAPERDDDGIAGNTEGLLQATFQAAQELIEGDWYAAARTTYRAAWYFHRLPDAAQRDYVATELLQDGGPLPNYGDWSMSAFVVWFTWRCNRLADAVQRESGHADAPQHAQRSIVQRNEINAVASLDHVQEGLL